MKTVISIVLWVVLTITSAGVASMAYAQAQWLWDLHAASLHAVDQPLSPKQTAWLGRDQEDAWQLLNASENRRRSDTRVAWLTLAAIAAWLTLFGVYRLSMVSLTRWLPRLQ